MDHLPLPKELDDVVDVRIIAQAQDVVIGDPGLLLRGQILGQVCDGVALDLHAGGGPGEAGGRGWVDARRVVHEVGGEGGVLDLAVRHFSGQLMDDGPDHLQMPQLLGAQSCDKKTPTTQNQFKCRQLASVLR